MNIYVQVGDKFKAGDILAESNFCHDGKVTFGKNLLTGVMVYYGNNYEGYTNRNDDCFFFITV